MKNSLYNFGFHLPDDDTYLLFNFYTLSLLALKPPESQRAQKMMANPNASSRNKHDSKLRRLLIEKGFLIDDGIDEVELLARFSVKARTQRRNLGMTIVPTLSCNFRCIYCYEKGTQQTMNKDVEDALLLLAEKNIHRGSHLSVTWFGGEPLLKIDIIERLSRGLIDICEKNQARYSAGIITNGYLLNRKNVERLRRLKVGHAQVTLDGPPEVHDRRRPLKNGQGTFWRIFRNIKEASKLMPIRLRMNVDQDNRDSIKKMVEMLSTEKLEKRIGFYLGQTYPYTSACHDMAGTCLSNEEFSLLSLETLLEMLKKGYSYTFNLPVKKDQYCLAGNLSAFVITPSGRIVNCWNDVDNPEAAIGHLLEPSTPQMKKLLWHWLSRNPFDLECRDCQLLPMCVGGCPHIHLNSGELSCHKWKYNLQESIAFYYLLQKMKQEKEIIQSFKQAVEALKELRRMGARSSPRHPKS